MSRRNEHAVPLPGHGAGTSGQQANAQHTPISISCAVCGDPFYPRARFHRACSRCWAWSVFGDHVRRAASISRLIREGVAHDRVAP